MKTKNITDYPLTSRPFLARACLFACLIFTILILGFVEADAATKKKQSTSKAQENKLYSALVLDAQTGEVLMARHADSIRHPASLTKIMTLYMVFEALDQQRLRMSDRIVITSHAASMAPSKLGIPAGGSIKVEDAIKIVVTKSANDISTALAEKIGGSERAFCARMTKKAHDLGMSRTTFRNASGLPDPQQVTTARDMAKLAMAMLRDYPHYYHYFGIRNFKYQGSVHGNHNRLLGEYPGLDGIKTGYINASGFNLVASAKQDNRRLIGVVFGGRSWRSRNDHMVKLLDEGFTEIKRRRGNIRQASLHQAPIPIPPLPPLREEDARSPNVASDETDTAEEGVSYTQADTRRITDMIDHLQDPVVRAPQTGTPPNAAANTSAVPIPTARPPLVASPQKQTTAAPPAPTTPPTTPMGAARTVMQLRIPAGQIPAGLAKSQIVKSGTPLGWSIQVGAFPSRVLTDQALRTAQSRLPSHLQGGAAVIVPQNTNTGLIFRGRLQGYNEIQANAACAHLGSCLVVAPGS